MKNLEITILLNYNHYAVNKNLEGITHEESLINPQAGGNCINMVLGHIVVTRDTLLEVFGFEGMCDEMTGKMYAQRAPLLEVEDAVNINELLKMYNEWRIQVISATT